MIIFHIFYIILWVLVYFHLFITNTVSIKYANLCIKTETKIFTIWREWITSTSSISAFESPIKQLHRAVVQESRTSMTRYPPMQLSLWLQYTALCTDAMTSSFVPVSHREIFTLLSSSVLWLELTERHNNTHHHLHFPLSYDVW